MAEIDAVPQENANISWRTRVGDAETYVQNIFFVSI